MRREKFAYFEKRCSEVAICHLMRLQRMEINLTGMWMWPAVEATLLTSRLLLQVSEGLFLGSEAVAKNREILVQSSITHVINCVGFIYPEYFKDELVYKTLRLQGMWPVPGPERKPTPTFRAPFFALTYRPSPLPASPSHRPLCLFLLLHLGIADTPTEDISGVMYDCFDFIEVGTPLLSILPATYLTFGPALC